MSREAQGLFGGNAALLTGLAVAQTAAAGNVSRARSIPGKYCDRASHL
jgi:hypothetical protein